MLQLEMKNYILNVTLRYNYTLWFDMNIQAEEVFGNTFDIYDGHAVFTEIDAFINELYREDDIVDVKFWSFEDKRMKNPWFLLGRAYGVLSEEELDEVSNDKWYLECNYIGDESFLDALDTIKDKISTKEATEIFSRKINDDKFYKDFEQMNLFWAGVFTKQNNL